MRALKDWLSSYLEFTEAHESPEKLHLWTGFSVLSTAMRRQAYMDRVFYKLYPNLYILIVAESARVRKSVAMEIGIRLLKEAIPDIAVITGAMTPEGLIKHMNRTTVITVPDKPQTPIVRKDSHILIYADEVATLFSYDRTRASRMAILLTEIYSSKEEHPHTTSKEGQIFLYNLYPTLLAATDPRNLKVLPEESVGGLIGRLIFVTANQRRTRPAWPEYSPKQEKLWQSLMADLFRIAALKGVFNPTPEAKELFAKWYAAQGEIKIEDPRLDAFHERCHDTVLKLAMLISVSRGDDLVVTAEHMAGGIAFIEQQLPEFSRVVNWAGASVFQQNRAKFIDTLRRNGGLSTRKIVLKALGVSLDDLTSLEMTLTQEGTITAEIVGREMLYRLSPDEMARSVPPQV